MTTQEFYQQLTNLQRENINKLKSKKVVKNSENRDVKFKNFNNNLLLQIYNITGNLMQGSIQQYNITQNDLENKC